MAGTPKFHSDMKMLSKIPEDMIWSMIEAGKTYTEICLEMGISRKALERWIDETDPDGDRIARARARAADELVTETLGIADRSDPEHSALDHAEHPRPAPERAAARRGGRGLIHRCDA